VATASRLSRTERAALTRRELLAAAERRFFRDGYHGTTLDDIADEAGYTKGAVYSTFKSKGGLFLALFDEIVDRRVEEIRQVLASHDDGDAKIAAVADQPVDNGRSQFLLLTIEFWVHAAREPALLDEFAERYRRLRAKLAEIAPAGAPFDEERWAIVTLAVSNGLALERLIDPDGVPHDLMASVQQRLFEPEASGSG
jgi:AcrR family transcriptional regulator